MMGDEVNVEYFPGPVYKATVADPEGRSPRLSGDVFIKWKESGATGWVSKVNVKVDAAAVESAPAPAPPQLRSLHSSGQGPPRSGGGPVTPKRQCKGGMVSASVPRVSITAQCPPPGVERLQTPNEYWKPNSEQEAFYGRTGHTPEINGAQLVPALG